MRRRAASVSVTLVAIAFAGCGEGLAPGPIDAAAPDTFRPADFGVPDSGEEDARGARDEGADAQPQRPFAVIVLPDTQFYSAFYPEVFEAQTRWIAEKKEELNIAFVLHLGDIVDSDWPTQWMAASKAMGLLDGKVPYVLAVGNHDLALTPMGELRQGMLNAFFPMSRFAGVTSLRGTYPTGDLHNSHHVFDVDGHPWQVVSLEFGPRDGALAWAKDILARSPTTPAIIITHAYLYGDGTRYDWKTKTGADMQYYSPHSYGLENQPGGVNDGEEIWQKLVQGSPNIQFVLSGHIPFTAAARLTSTRTDGGHVHQILSNYQYYLVCPCPQNHGGGGYLRIMEFSPADRRVRVRSYSPYLRQSLTDPQSDFELPLD
jgi:hypothetical protein